MADENRDRVHDVWQQQPLEAPRMTPAEIRSRIARSERLGRRRIVVGLVICAFLVAAYAWWLAIFPDVLQRAGSVLALAGVAYFAWQLSAVRRAEAADARAMDAVTPSAEFYRAILVRQRDFHGGPLFWARLLALIPGPMIFLAGFARRHPEVAGTIRAEAVSIVVVAVAAIALNRWMARAYQRRIDEVDRFRREA